MTARALALVSILAAGILLSAAVCGSGAERDDDATPVRTPSLTPVAISWDEMVDHIMSCDAVSASQAHSRYVEIGLRGGGRVWAYEPRLDDMFDVFREAVDGGCEPIPLATE